MTNASKDWRLIGDSASSRGIIAATHLANQVFLFGQPGFKPANQVYFPANHVFLSANRLYFPANQVFFWPTGS